MKTTKQLDVSEKIMQPGWQLCTKIERPRDKQGKTFYLQGRPDSLGFFEAIKLSDLENVWIKLPAPAQRHFFGANIFGKKSIKVSDTGMVSVFWTVAFGGDWERADLRYDQLKKAFVYDGTEDKWNRKNV